MPLRLVLVLGSLLLCLGCGDDDPSEEGGSDGGSQTSDDEGVTWECTCWTRSGDGPRNDEQIVRCSADDPTDMLDARSAAAAEMVDREGGCDPCERTEHDCVLED